MSQETYVRLVLVQYIMNHFYTIYIIYNIDYAEEQTLALLPSAHAFFWIVS